MDPTLKQLLMVVFAALVSGAAVWFWRGRDAQARMGDRIADVETAVAVLNAAAIPLNAVLQNLLIKNLTHYHTPEMDALMVKLGDGTPERPRTITDAEERRLVVMLEERTRDMGSQISASERQDAAMLPIVMQRVKRDAKAIASGEKFERVQIVGLLAEGGEEGQEARPLSPPPS